VHPFNPCKLILLAHFVILATGNHHSSR
jgi:hypothetical protein